jgi:hypothetical protein
LRTLTNLELSIPAPVDLHARCAGKSAVRGVKKGNSGLTLLKRNEPSDTCHR